MILNMWNSLIWKRWINERIQIFANNWSKTFIFQHQKFDIFRFREDDDEMNRALRNICMKKKIFEFWIEENFIKIELRILINEFRVAIVFRVL